MIQFPDEKKDPQSDWVSPGQQAPAHTAPSFSPPTENPPYPYAAATAPGQGASSYAMPPTPSQGYAPPQGPPPDYVYAQTHPDGRSPYDQRGAPHHEAYPPPPVTSPYRTPAPDVGTSSSPPAQDPNHMSLGSFFGNKGTPPMWQRHAPPQLPYNAFPPMCLISNSKDLGSGFPELPPPCQLNPHPFATHDVTEEDWKRFLLDLKRAAALSPVQRIRSNVLPMLMGAGLFGFFITSSIEKKMKYKNRSAAGDLVDHWNHYFFGPRRMEVVLCQASQRLSGKLGDAPVGDPNQERMANGLRRRGSSSSLSSSSEDNRYNRQGYGDNRHGDRHTRRAARRERREERRGRRDQKRAERREWKASGDNLVPYQLFVTAIN